MASSDWLEFMLDRRMAYWPDTRFQYNSGCTILLAGVLAEATGRQAHELAEERLFAPLGVSYYDWQLGPGGLTDTGGGLWLRPRDMAKFGQLYLQAGAWRGRQLVPAAWIPASMEYRSIFDDGSGYGYQWWLLPQAAGADPGAGPDIWIAWGWGGQHIFVVPALDLVAVSTAGDYNDEYSGLVSHIQEFLAAVVKPPDGDLTGDGLTDAADLAVLAHVLAGNLNPEEPPCLWPPMGDLNGNGRLDAVDLAELGWRLVNR
jgi:CubicO group peptidase (beta-lactamase class C family)